MYLDAVSGVAELSMRASLSKKDEVRLAGLMSTVAQGKVLFSAEQIRSATRDRVLREAGLPREPEKIQRRVPEEVDRDYRMIGLGREVRMTRVPDDLEARSNLAGTESISYQGDTGSRFVPWGMWQRFLPVQKQHDQIFEDWAHLPIRTDTGNPFQLPELDDVSINSVQVSEGVKSNEADVNNFGQLQLAAYTQRSQRVVVSLELLEDANFPLGDVLETVFAARFARGVGSLLINGTGVGQPTGLLTAALSSGANVTVAVGSSVNDGTSNTGSNSIGTDDLINTMKGLDPAYWPGSLWCMHPATLLSLWSQRDKSGRPLVDGSILSPDGGPVGMAPFIMGKRVVVSPSMPKIGNGANSVILYHPNYFCVRTVPSSMYVRVFREAANLIDFGLIAYEAFYRVDSQLSVPNRNFAPVSVLANHS
jgi:HK97 family phage major capsid protein